MLQHLTAGVPIITRPDDPPGMCGYMAPIDAKLLSIEAGQGGAIASVLRGAHNGVDIWNPLFQLVHMKPFTLPIGWEFGDYMGYLLVPIRGPAGMAEIPVHVFKAVSKGGLLS